MKKIYLAYFLVACQILSASNARAGGTSTDGGGHGVVDPSGTVKFLDLIEHISQPSCRELPKVQIDLFENELTQPAMKEVVQRLDAFANAYPVFYRSTIDSIKTRIKWHLTDYKLGIVMDHDVKVEGNFPLVQIAKQCGRGYVVIDQNLFKQLSIRDQAALIVHEAFMAKLGLLVPRGLLRQVIRLLFADDMVPLDLIAQELNKLDRNILLGHHRVFVDVNRVSGISLITISNPSDPNDKIRSCRSYYSSHDKMRQMQSRYGNEVLQNFYWSKRESFVEWFDEENWNIGRAPLFLCAAHVNKKRNLTDVSVEFKEQTMRRIIFGQWSWGGYEPTFYRVYVNGVLQDEGQYELGVGEASVRVPVELW